FFFSSRRRHTRSKRDWSSDVCSSDLDRLPFHDGRQEGIISQSLFPEHAIEMGQDRLFGTQILPDEYKIIPDIVAEYTGFILDNESFDSLQIIIIHYRIHFDDRYRRYGFVWDLAVEEVVCGQGMLSEPVILHCIYDFKCLAEMVPELIVGELGCSGAGCRCDDASFLWSFQFASLDCPADVQGNIADF